MRIKSTWHKKRDRSVEEIANTIGYNIWKISTATTDKLYTNGFNFSNHNQLIQTITECSIFLLQIAAVSLHSRLNDEEFQLFIAASGKKLLSTIKENLQQDDNSGTVISPQTYITLLNQRLSDYADFSYPDAEPSFHSLRYFAESVEQLLLVDEKNKWVKEQMLEVEAPVMLRELKKSINALFPQESD